MGSIADKLNYLIETKNRIKVALASKNVAITDETPFREYPALIESISGNGGNVAPVACIVSSSDGIVFPTGSILETPEIIYEQEGE